MFCEERSDSLSLTLGFVECSDRLLLWSEATVYYYFCGFVLFLLWFCGAKRSIHRSLGFVERSDVLFLLCFCGAKRPFIIDHSVLWSETTGCFCFDFSLVLLS